MSLSDYIKNELQRTAELPTMREWLERNKPMKAIRGKPSAMQIIRQMRDSR